MYHCTNNTSNAKELSELLKERTELTQNVSKHLATIGKLEYQLQQEIGSNNVLQDLTKFMMKYDFKQKGDASTLLSKLETHFKEWKESTMRNKRELEQQEQRIQSLEKNCSYSKEKIGNSKEKTL